MITFLVILNIKTKYKKVKLFEDFMGTCISVDEGISQQQFIIFFKTIINFCIV